MSADTEKRLLLDLAPQAFAPSAAPVDSAPAGSGPATDHAHRLLDRLRKREEDELVLIAMLAHG